MQRGEYVILSESDFEKYDEECKEGEKMSASHRNKLKPGKCSDDIDSDKDNDSDENKAVSLVNIESILVC